MLEHRLLPQCATLIGLLLVACGCGPTSQAASRGSSGKTDKAGSAGTGGSDVSADAGDSASPAGSGGTGGGDVSGGGSGGGFQTVEAGTANDAAGLGDGCASSTYAGEQMPLDIFIMYDQSGSMKDMVAGGVTKWVAIRDAFLAFVNDPGSDGISIGIQYFPLNGGSCTASDYASPDVPVQLLPPVRPAIVSSFNGHNPGNGGGTPTSAAVQGAVDYATGWATAHPDRKTILVLATDGDPNGCDEDIGNIAAIAATGLMSNPPVSTFVIGVGSSLTSLDAIAAGGGTGQALIVDTTMNPGQEFLAAMNKIRGTALSCDFLLPKPDGTGMLDYTKINVNFTPKGGSEELLGNSPDLAGCDPTAGGWYYDDPTSPTKITLCPATCDAVTGMIGGTINMVLGCRTIMVIPH